MTRTVILSGPERRRNWPPALRAEILAEAFRPGAVVSEVARRYDVATSRLYTWRKEMLPDWSGPGFVEAVVSRSSSITPEPASSCVIAVRLASGARVRINAGASAELVTATLKALS